jgi:spermidine/putrescine transport system ATP-binding protein
MIVMSGVSRWFGAFRALEEVDLTIGEGEFFSLLGPSGCGKTTLLRMIAGFQEPSSGTIAIDGQPVGGVPPNQRPTNMVFQSYAIFPHLSVAENVAYGLKRLRLGQTEEASRVAAALEQVALTGLDRRRAHELSGGQRQRVALARALVLRPKVLLLDEPLSALDKKLRGQMQVELRSLQRQVGITFVLVTHDQYEALAMSDRIAVMFDGRIAQVDTPKQVYQHPASRRVADFLGGMNFLRGTVVERRAGLLSVRTEALGLVELADRDDLAGRTEITLGIRPERLRILWDEATAPREISGSVSDRQYFGEITSLVVRVPGLEKPLWVTEANTFGADDLPIGAPLRLSYDPDALVPLGD